MQFKDMFDESANTYNIPTKEYTKQYTNQPTTLFMLHSHGKHLLFVFDVKWIETLNFEVDCNLNWL